ncbi:nucleoid-associated protein [Deefgea sp. CFH1-16]|uniref:nucleoid-associated protein n=1 Tax=Deefgea sp. CFH1-16 TaxID=2675457 RepID=UPI0015F6554F|nr:nucleoid-associated protein [Deefgea sp. CFH1-16]MBM5575244.1 hypothetical protein [Deefgea sp. CFH1-16]
MDIILNHPVITKMAMHVVGDSANDEARHLPATEVVHQGFFIDRITETLKGCKCSFTELSSFRMGLKQVREGELDFYEMSKLLANSFHRAITGNGAAVPGAFLLFEIENSGEVIYSVIKYEHDDVVHYKQEINDAGESKLIFTLLATTFVKKPQAMQKSALIKFTDDESIIHVVDRSERKGITKYFSLYLDVVREYNEAEVTSRFVNSVLNFVDRAIKAGFLSRDVRKTYRSRMYDYTHRENVVFDPEDIATVITAIVGESNDNLVSIFESELKKNKIEGERFEFDKATIPRPAKLRTRTVDGIEINFSQSHIESGKYEKVGNIIKIDITTGLEEDANQLG